MSKLLCAVPWQEPEWFAAAAGGGARAIAAASSALLPRLGTLSVASAWGYGPAPPRAGDPARPARDAAAGQEEL